MACISGGMPVIIYVLAIDFDFVYSHNFGWIEFISQIRLFGAICGPSEFVKAIVEIICNIRTYYEPWIRWSLPGFRHGLSSSDSKSNSKSGFPLYSATLSISTLSTGAEGAAVDVSKLVGNQNLEDTGFDLVCGRGCCSLGRCSGSTLRG
jgi:hypothetical protein